MIVLVTQYCTCDKIEMGGACKIEMGGACSAYRGGKRRVQAFGAEASGKETAGETQA